MADDRLLALVVLVLPEDWFGADDVPAGERAGGFADVLLSVMADAEAEPLHQLAGVILVGVALGAALGVEPDHHGRVARHALE